MKGWNSSCGSRGTGGHSWPSPFKLPPRGSWGALGTCQAHSQCKQKEKLWQRHIPRMGSSHHSELSPFQQNSTNPLGCKSRANTCGEWPGHAGGSRAEGGDRHLLATSAAPGPSPLCRICSHEVQKPHLKSQLMLCPAEPLCWRQVLPGCHTPVPGPPRLQHPGCSRLSCGRLGALHSLWTSGKLPQFAPVAASPAAGAWPGTQGVL